MLLGVGRGCSPDIVRSRAYAGNCVVAETKDGAFSKITMRVFPQLNAIADVLFYFPKMSEPAHSTPQHSVANSIDSLNENAITPIG